MKSNRVYLGIIVLLLAIIVTGYFTFVKQGLETRKNYKTYIDGIRKLGSNYLPLSESLGLHYMKKYQADNGSNFHGIILTKEIVDFYKFYLDKNDDMSISIGFSKYDTTGFSLSGLSDEEYVRRQNMEALRQPRGRYGLIFGVIQKDVRGIQPFIIDGTKFYDNWNQEWP